MTVAPLLRLLGVVAAVVTIVGSLVAILIGHRHGHPTKPRAALYVSQETGHDRAHAGQASAPFQSIGYALRHVHPGTTVHVGAGTYAPFAITVRDVTVTGVAPAQVIVSGRPDLQGIAQLAAAHTTVSNMTFTGCVPNASPPGGFEAGGSSSVYVGAGATGATVSGVIIDQGTATTGEGLPFGCFGVYLSQPVGVTVANNDVSGQGEGVFVFRKGQSVKIVGNSIHDNNVEIRNTTIPNDDFGGTAIGLFETSGTPGPLVSGNTMYGNVAPSHDYGTDGGAFDLFEASDARMIHNRIYNNENVLETGAGAAADRCRNNVFSQNTVNGRTAGSRLTHSVGMILRCASDMTITANTFSHLDWYVFDIEQRGRWVGVLHNLAISGNSIDQGVDLVYVLMVDASSAHITINRNHYTFKGPLGLDWKNQHSSSLASWQNATRMDSASN